jgi:fibronectin-binding autotransporter adhesin
VNELQRSQELFRGHGCIAMSRAAPKTAVTSTRTSEPTCSSRPEGDCNVSPGGKTNADFAATKGRAKGYGDVLEAHSFGACVGEASWSQGCALGFPSAPLRGNTAPSRNFFRLFSMRILRFCILAACCLAGGAAAMGSGGGESMLLVVNPNDPASLQIANAYAALRAIPSNNILFIAPPADYHNDGQPITQAEATNYYLTPIANAISARHLANQINYIGTIGEALSYSINATAYTPATTANSLNYALSLLTPLTNGSGLTLQNATSNVYWNGSSWGFGATSGLYDTTPNNIPVGSNTAIQHSASYSVYYPMAGSSIATQYYMSGAIGYTGTNGNMVGQVITSLQSAAASDGTRPAGTVYFEDNGDVRSTTRDGQWAATQSQLSALSISNSYERNTPGNTPQNRNNVLGAVCGSATLTLPNGSTYLPGSWADNLTSYGCYFPDTSQTKSTAFIAAGAAGTTGSVIEPYAIAARFTNSSIFTFIGNGSTLGEAFAKSVASPDIQLPLGDLLAQPFADVPTAAFTSGPVNFSAAQGTISVGASASLTSPHIATAISQLEMLVDGLASSSGTLAGGSGTFSLSTTDLSDGVHEVRVVAFNNAQAASEGYAAVPIVVNNHSRSVNFNGGNLTLTSSATTVGLAVAAGDGAVSQTTLTCLGRVVAQASGAAGSLSLSPTTLAPGDNVIVPVAVFSDGSRVAGGAFVVHVQSGAVNGWTNGAGTWLWSNSGNWSGGTLPQKGDGVARFSGATSGGTVTLDASANVAEIDFDNSGGGNYQLAASPGQTLTLSTSNGPMSQCAINILGGNHTISAPLVLSALGSLVQVTNSTDSLTLSGNISGGGALTKTGAGLLVLAASNSYGGATTVSAGTIALGAAASLPNNAAVTVNGTLDLGAFGATFSALTGFGTVVHSATGGSTLAVGSGAFAGTVKNSGGTLALLKTGSGQLLLSGVNTYTGGTTVSAGELEAASVASLPGFSTPNAVSVSGGAVLAVQTSGGVSAGWNASQIGTLLTSASWSGSPPNNAPVLGMDTTNGDFTFVGNISQAIGLTKLGSNVLLLSGSNTYSGVTAIKGGVLALGSTGALGGGNITFLGGTLQFTSSSTMDYSAQFANNTAAQIRIDTNGQAVTFGSSIASNNTAGLAKTGNGTLTLGVDNSYTGGTTVNGGTLVAASNAALSSGPVVLSPSSITATLAFTSPAPSIGSLASSGSGLTNIVLGNATALASSTLLTVGADNASTTFSGAISDLISGAPAAVGSLMKAGSGILTLTGVNVYSGTTTVAKGALSVASTASLPGYNLSNKVSVAAGAVLAVRLGEGTTGWSSTQITNLLADVHWADSTASLGIDTTNGNATYSGHLANPVGLTKLGANRLLLIGNNTYSGPTTVSRGTLSIGDGSAVGVGLASPGVGVSNGATLEFNLPDTLSYGGTISGPGQLFKAGAGQLILTGNNSYSGPTTANAGTLRMDSPGALSAASSLLINGGSLDLGGNTFTQIGASIVFVGGVVQNGSLSYAGTYTAVPGSGTAATISANLGGSAGVSMTGAGVLLLTGVNTYSGSTSVTRGALDAATTASLPGYNSPNAVSIDGGAVLAVQTSGVTTGWNATQIGSLLTSASWSNSTPNNAPALGVDTTNGDFTYGGGIPKAIGLIKLGNNNLTLTAANTMNGNLINAGPGTLTIANTLAFGGVDSSYNSLGIVQIHQGQINVVSGGALTNLSEIDVGDTRSQSGTLNLTSGTALVPNGSNSWSGVNVGYNGSTGILNLTGKSVLDATATNGYVNGIDIGFDSNSFTGSAGTVTVGGNSVMRAASPSYIVVGDGGNGVLAVSGSGIVEAGIFQLGSRQQSGAVGGTGTLYLNGGTLSVPQVQNASGTTGNLYFNGGTLQATGTSSDFLQSSGGGTLKAYVQHGGVAIDTNGNNVTIASSLVEDPGATGGGLIKTGAGMLILIGTNTFTGTTTVLGGKLEVNFPTALLDGTSLSVGSSLSAFPGELKTPVGGSAGSSAVPEPGTLALLAVLALCSAAVHRRLRLRSRIMTAG